VSAEEQRAIDAWNLRTWMGPPELKPRVYRNQREKDTWFAVAVENEYRLPDTLNTDDVVVDLGSNIGAFSMAAYVRGSRTIYAFEIDPWHTEIAAVNLGDKRDGIQAYHAAVVRGDSGRARQYHYGGGETCFSWFGEAVRSYSLDEILDEVKDPVRFLKIDIEGAEWSVLSTCTKLDRVQEIAGEYHTVSDSGVAELQNLPIAISVDGLRSFLEYNGFAVEIVEKGATGNFYARRSASVGYTFRAPASGVPLTVTDKRGEVADLPAPQPQQHVFFGKIE
jgi:FkbM family methyltransferase